MASYTTIIAAIDNAIETWAGSPLSIQVNNRTTTYRSLEDLLKARRYYAQLQANANAGRPFRISEIKANGMR